MGNKKLSRKKRQRMRKAEGPVRVDRSSYEVTFELTHLQYTFIRDTICKKLLLDEHTISQFARESTLTLSKNILEDHMARNSKANADGEGADGEGDSNKDDVPAGCTEDDEVTGHIPSSTRPDGQPT